MPNIYHILTTEILLTAFVSTILVPSQIIFAEDIPHIDVPVVITEILPVAITDSGTTSHLPSKDGSMRSEDVTTDTGSITSSGYSATSSGTTILENIISSITPPIDTESITTTGSINDRESELDLSDPSLKMSSHPTDTHPEAQILVQFKTDIDGYIGQYQVDQVENTHDLKTTETISEQNIAVMEIDNPATIDMVSSMSIADSFVHTGSVDPVLEQAIDDKIEELKTDPRVEHVQRNFVYQTQATVNSGFPQLWALDNQGQSVNGITGTPDADIDYPEAITYAGNKIGSGVIVAVLDTGVAYRHPDLAPHMWDGANCLSDTGATLGGCIHGYDFTNNDLDPMDDMRHGTHVAGTIGGVSNSDGVTGVALNVQIMAVKVLSPYGGTTSDIIRGINFAAKNGARVINASLGIMRSTHTKSDFDYLMYGAIQDFPGLFVAAAGNSGMNSDGTYKSFPAGFGSDTVVS